MHWCFLHDNLLLLLLLPSAEITDVKYKNFTHYLHSCSLAQRHRLFQALSFLASWVSDSIQGSCSCTFPEDILLTRGCRAGSSRGGIAGDLRLLNEPSGTGACSGILLGQFNSFGSFWIPEKRNESEAFLSWPIIWRTTFRFMYATRQGEHLLMTARGRNTEKSALNPSDHE